MSAQELRDAAALMRARGEVAVGGRWRTEPGSVGSDDQGNWWPSDYIATPVRRRRFRAPNADDAAHIAAADPTVMLAVADWLEHTALAHAKGYAAPLEAADALAVARAYLRSDQ